MERAGSDRLRAWWPALALVAALGPGGPAGATPIFDQARELLADGKVADAQTLAETGLRQQPDDPPLWRLLGEARSRQGRYRPSFSAYRESLGLRPGDPQVVSALGALRRPLVAELRTTLREAPGDTEARHALAFLLLLEGKGEKGKAQLERLVVLAPGFAAGWNDLGWVRFMQGARAEAFQAASRALELDPGSPLVRRHFRLVQEGRSGSGPPGSDRLFGVLAPGGAGPGSGPPPAAGAGDPTSLPGTPPAVRIDFGRVNLDDEELVASLLGRIEAETLGTPASGATTATSAAVIPPPESPETTLLPTPLEVLERLQGAYATARGHLDAHRYKDAERELRLVCSLKRDYKDAAHLLRGVERTLGDLERLDQGKLLVDAGDGRRALSELQAVPRKLVEQARPNLDLDALLGVAYSLSGDHVSAEKYLRGAVGRAPKEAELQYRLFLSLVEQGRAGEALERLAILDAARPGYAARKEGYRKLVLRLYIRKYFLLIAALAGLWILMVVGYLAFAGKRKVTADAFTTWAEEGQEALRKGDFKLALERAVRLDGLGLEGDRRQRAAVLRITAQVGTGQVEEAAAGLEALEADLGESLATRVLRGRVLLARREAGAEARPYLRDLLAAEPSNRAVLELLHESSWAEGDLSAEGREVLGRLLDLDPDHPQYLLRMTSFMAAQGDTSAAAVRTYRRALQIDAGHLEAHRMLARALMEASQALEALRELKEALKLAPGDVELLGLAGAAYRQLELLDEGVAHFERLLEAGAGEAARQERDALEGLRRSRVAEDQRTRDEERTVGASYDEGVQLFSQGHFAEARAPLSQAMEAASYRKHAGALLVKAHLALGETETAWEVYQGLEVGETLSDEFMIGLCYDMASALEKRSEHLRARDLYRLVCKADVDYKDAFERFEELEEQLQLSSD